MTDIVERLRKCGSLETAGIHGIAADTIESLRAELARAKQCMIEADAKYERLVIDDTVELSITDAQLTAALVREQQLRGALERIVEPPSEPVLAGLTRLRIIASEALATKPDDSALKKYVAKEQVEMLREKAEWFDEHDSDAAEHLRRMADELEAKFK